MNQRTELAGAAVQEGRLLRSTTGLGDIPLQITTSQSADDIAARIKAHGSALDTEPTRMPWGVTILRVRDLDGFRLTISSTHAV